MSIQKITAETGSENSVFNRPPLKKGRAVNDGAGLIRLSADRTLESRTGVMALSA
jgi:hypothetical protein